MQEKLIDVVKRVGALNAVAKRISAKHESSVSRVITLEDTYDELTNLSLLQDELFRESLRAVEQRLYRAAHVLAWAGFMDFLHELLFAKSLPNIQTNYPSWAIGIASDFRDQSDFQVIEAGKKVGAYSKTQMKALHGLLNKRNECGHPSDFYPDLNETLGYVSELLGRAKKL